MNLKGIVRMELVDQVTGKVRVHQQENFIFRDQFMGLLTDSNSTINGMLVRHTTNRDIFPVYHRMNTDIIGQSIPYLTGTNYSSKFFPKTSESPPYLEYYALFLPGTETRRVHSVSLGIYGSQSLTKEATAINLLPYCEQTSTEYLNIYYRVILVEDEQDNENSDWIRNTFLSDFQETNYKKISLRSNGTNFYPFRIEEDLGRNGMVNFLPTISSGNFNNPYATDLDVTVDKYKINLNGGLRYTHRVYAEPKTAPQQYSQIVDSYSNTVIRFGYGNISGSLTNIGLHPFKFTPDLGEKNSGIGNVFGTNSKSDNPTFDPTNFTVGSGRMFASGTWNVDKNPFPSRFVATIKKTAQTATEMQYQVLEYHTSPLAILPLIGSTSEVVQNEMYKDRNRIHMNTKKIRPFIPDRIFVTWDDTGIMFYDIYHGKPHIFDAQSNPPLPVTKISDVKVDSNGNVWVGCENTGIWKLKFDPDQDFKELTEIGAPPGCQSKVYALDVDNFGNVFAIFWGLGLHYSVDGGETWVNAIINFSSFSEMDEGGLNSKWRFCSVLYCNPHKNVRDGNAQLILLQASDVNDGNRIAGCWYDQISANTTGITHSFMLTGLSVVRRNPARTMIVCSKESDKWFFIDGSNIRSENFNNQVTGTSTRGYSYEITAMKFQQNNQDFTKVYSWNNRRIEFLENLHLFYFENWDSTTGKVREYVGVPAYDPVNSQVTLYDMEYMHSVWENSFGDKSYYNDYRDGTMIGRNRQVGVVSREIVGVGYGIYPAKKNALYTADLWGWDGGQWQKNHPGTRNGHYTYEDFVKGIQLKFQDGPTGSTSFNATDQYTFTCFDGYYKDNASKIWFKDTVYFKPRKVISEFTPSVVSVYDKTQDIGLLNNSNINVDWDISRMPDTTYDGSPLVTDGDDLYGNAIALIGFDTLEDKSEKKQKGTVVGDLQPDGTVKIEWPEGSQSNTTYFDGHSGITITGDDVYLANKPFTLETWIYLTERSDSSQMITDFRNERSDEMGSFSINRDGRLGWSNGSAEYANGPVVPLNTWVHVSLVRKTHDSWMITMNGQVINEWNEDVSFRSPKKLNIGKRFEKQTRWHTQYKFLSFLEEQTDPLGGKKATGIIMRNSNIGDRLIRSNIEYTSGSKTFSVFLKKGSVDTIDLSFSLGSVSRSATYNFNSGTFTQEYGVGMSGKENYSGNWVRLWLRVEPDSQGTDGTVEVRLPTNNHVGGTESPLYYIFGAMINEGDSPIPYQPSGTTENLILEDSENFAGTFRGIRGYMSNYRLTLGARYQGNHQVPTKPYPNYVNDFSGARLKFSKDHHQGSVLSKKELVGDWEVIFKDIEPYMREYRRERPSLIWGITSSPTVTDYGDIGFRFVPSGGNNFNFYEWISGQQLAIERPQAVKIRKNGQGIQLLTQGQGEPGFSLRLTWIDHAPIHYIAIWQNSPAIEDDKPNVSPAVEIVKNGKDYVSKIGNQSKANGSYHPKFLAADCYWKESYTMTLDDNAVLNQRSNYENENTPLAGECYVHEHGAIRFHESDLGKTIGGKIICLHE